MRKIVKKGNSRSEKKKKSFTRREERHINNLAKYGKIYQEIIEILWEHDPIRLCDTNRQDEYMPEAETIVARLEEAGTREELCHIVYEEFLNWFGTTAGKEEDYIKITNDIWLAW